MEGEKTAIAARDSIGIFLWIKSILKGEVWEMAIRQCSRGHFYDYDKHSECPICLAEQKASGLSAVWQEERTLAFDEGEKTVAVDLMEEDRQARPVVGWLVCVRGGECGRDWRLSAGRNDLGTVDPADVLLESAAGIQECRLCSVVYDNKHDEFLLVPGRGELVRRNNGLLVEPILLQDGDEIEIEGYLLCFQRFHGLSKKYW